MMHIFEDLQDLRASTEILEALDWDQKRFELFMEELQCMLLAAPPSVDKALFWLKNTPWDVFNRENIPTNIYLVLESSIKRAEVKMKRRLEMTRMTTLPPPLKSDEWN